LRIAVFSDVHGNYINLLSFFESTERLDIDKYICLGDLCNYYPDSEKVIDLIQQKQITCLLGNHDEFYIKEKKLSKEKKKSYNFSKTLLKSETHISFLRSLPFTYHLTENDKSIIFCHASPKDFLYTPIYPNSDLNLYKNEKYDIFFIGHTHRQFIKSFSGKIFCNVGSIGSPRDNGSLMSFAVIDTFDNNIKLYRKKIDCDSIIKTYGHIVTQEVIEILKRRDKISYPYIMLNG